jgi:hypothetical protein
MTARSMRKLAGLPTGYSRPRYALLCGGYSDGAFLGDDVEVCERVARLGRPVTRGHSLLLSFVADGSGRLKVRTHSDMSALGHKADICSAKRHVRFTPKSDIRSRVTNASTCQ